MGGIEDQLLKDQDHDEVYNVTVQCFAIITYTWYTGMVMILQGSLCHNIPV